MGWNKAKKIADESGGGLFLELKDGDEKQVIVMSEPVEFFSIFGDKTNKEYTTQVPGSSFKFKVQIIEINGATLEPRLWSGGKRVFDRLYYLQTKMGGVSDKILLVAREGSGKEDTKYQIDIQAALTPEQKERIKAVKLPSMERKETKDFPELPDLSPLSDQEPPLPDDSDIPF